MGYFHPGSSRQPQGRNCRRAAAAFLGAGLLLMIGADTASASPADEARVAGVVSAAIYADNHDFGPLERYFASETIIDYTSLWGGEPQRFTPSGLMDAWSGLLPGFDATHHELSDIHVTIDGSIANARAQVRAVHWLDDRTWVVTGSYDYALIHSDEGWRVSRMTLRLAEETGDRKLVEEAAARVASAE